MDSVTRFSTLGFFHQTIPPRALIHGLKPFRIWLRIRRENRDNLNLNISTTLFIHTMVVFCTKLRLKKFGFHGLIESAEAASAVSYRLRKLLPQSDRDRRSFMTPQKPLRKQILALISFKGIL
jgi:hypothetical protein